jgi:DNA-binding LacI/PurR family transcriptional regulator
MTRSHPTIRQVAAKAGVSHQTISRVINGSERVSPETRAKVEVAIAEMGFSPNAMARLLAQGRSFTLACISPNLTDYTFASIIEGAETEARSLGFFLISVSAPEPASFSELVRQLVASRRAEGLMVINPYADGRYTCLPADVPTVLLGARPRPGLDLDAVSLDDVSAGREAARHLLGLGHRHIATITGPLAEDCTQDRLLGCREALGRAGLELEPALTQEGDWSASSGYAAMQAILASGREITALFAQNDRMAVGAIRALREAGLGVPADVSVIGFDDMPLASYFDPPLTTLRQDTFEMGRQAARMLVEAIQNADAPRCHRLLTAELVARASTRAAV